MSQRIGDAQKWDRRKRQEFQNDALIAFSARRHGDNRESNRFRTPRQRTSSPDFVGVAPSASSPGPSHSFGCQFRISVMGEAAPSSVVRLTRNRWPSEDTAYCCCAWTLSKLDWTFWKFALRSASMPGFRSHRQGHGRPFQLPANEFEVHHFTNRRKISAVGRYDDSANAPRR